MIYGVGVRLTSGCIARSGAMARVAARPTFLLSHSLTDADTWVQSELGKCFYYRKQIYCVTNLTTLPTAGPAKS